MAKDLRRELRDAIQSGDFELVSTILPQIRDDIARQLIAVHNEVDRGRILRESLDFLEESLHLARVMRAHLAAKLRTVGLLSRYQSQIEDTSRWSASG